MSREQFRELMRAWRVQHPNPREDYIMSIPRHVADSMALEGEHVSLEFLQRNLERV